MSPLFVLFGIYIFITVLTLSAVVSFITDTISCIFVLYDGLFRIELEIEIGSQKGVEDKVAD